MNFRSAGLWYLYARFNTTEAPVFPIELVVSSTQVDPDTSQIEDLEIMAYQICSIPLEFDIALRDSEGGALTESNYVIDLELLINDGSGLTYGPTSLEKLPDSDFLYRASIVAYVRGWYTIAGSIFEVDE